MFVNCNSLFILQFLTWEKICLCSSLSSWFGRASGQVAALLDPGYKLPAADVERFRPLPYLVADTTFSVPWRALQEVSECPCSIKAVFRFDVCKSFGASSHSLLSSHQCVIAVNRRRHLDESLRWLRGWSRMFVIVILSR